MCERRKARANLGEIGFFEVNFTHFLLANWCASCTCTPSPHAHSGQVTASPWHMTQRASRLQREDSCVSACAAVRLGLEEIRTGFLPRASPRQRCPAPQGAMLLARRRRGKFCLCRRLRRSPTLLATPMSLHLHGCRRSYHCPCCLRLCRCSPRRCLRLRAARRLMVLRVTESVLAMTAVRQRHPAGEV